MRSQSGRRDSARDSGFTLIELVVAVLIIGTITVPLANVLIGFLRNSDTTTARLIESHDVQIASAYWAQDVASIGTRSAAPAYSLNQSVETNVAYDAGLYPCGPAGTPKAVARLAWDDFNAGVLTVVRVAYIVKTTAAGPTELRRLRCDASGVTDTILAHDLDPVTTPLLTCSTTCTATPVPETASLRLTLKDPKNRGSAYVVTLTGQRRQGS